MLKKLQVYKFHTQNTTLGIFVLTKGENFTLDTLDKIDDLDKKRQVLLQYIYKIQIYKKNKLKEFIQPNTYSFSKLIDRTREER